MLRWLTLLVLAACSGTLRPDLLPKIRPSEPYLCVRNNGGGELSVFTSVMPDTPLMHVGAGEVTCRTLDLSDQPVFVAFREIAGPAYVTPAPFIPAFRSCWFVEVGFDPHLNLADIRPCIEPRQH